MSGREKIKEFVINARISDSELPQKVAQAFSADASAPAPNTRLDLEIVFDKSVYQQAAFYQYQLTQEHKGPATERKTAAPTAENLRCFG